jgi:hypothetical protein
MNTFFWELYDGGSVRFATKAFCGTKCYTNTALFTPSVVYKNRSLLVVPGWLRISDINDRQIFGVFAVLDNNPFPRFERFLGH